MALDTALLQDAIPEPGDRKRLLSVLLDRTLGRVEGLHLTQTSLDARVVDETLPLLAAFDDVLQSLPGKAVLDSVDLLDFTRLLLLHGCGTSVAASGCGVVVLCFSEHF